MSETASELFPLEADRRPIVVVKGDEVFASSRDVAAFFGKQHFAVLRDIRNLIAKEPSLGDRNFVAFKNSDLTGETTSHYEMDRDGFTLLAMGFTGEKALKWKLRYIEAFNSMEADLRARALDPLEMLKDPNRLLPLLESYARDKQQLAEQVETMRPKVEAHDRIAGLEGSFCVRDAAKNLQIPESILWRYLRANGWTYRRPGSSADIAYSARMASGDLTHKVMEYPRPDGTVATRTQVRVTPKGLTVLAKAFPPKAQLV